MSICAAGRWRCRRRTFDGTLWFFTRASSHKVVEVAEDQRVNLSYAHPGKQDYVSVSGRASLVRDRAAIDEHWTESLRTWFPKGKDDPEIALLKVDRPAGGILGRAIVDHAARLRLREGGDDGQVAGAGRPWHRHDLG